MIKVDEAIRIAKIIEYCPEDRLAMIVDVFNEAGISIESLRFKADINADVDVDSLLGGIEESFRLHKNKENGLYEIPSGEFSEYCEKKGINPYKARADLARMGILQTSKDSGRTKYTVTRRKDGRVFRCIVLKVD